MGNNLHQRCVGLGVRECFQAMPVLFSACPGSTTAVPETLRGGKAAQSGVAQSPAEGRSR